MYYFHDRLSVCLLAGLHKYYRLYLPEKKSSDGFWSKLDPNKFRDYLDHSLDTKIIFSFTYYYVDLLQAFVFLIPPNLTYMESLWIHLMNGEPTVWWNIPNSAFNSDRKVIQSSYNTLDKRTWRKSYYVSWWSYALPKCSFFYTCYVWYNKKITRLVHILKNYQEGKQVNTLLVWRNIFLQNYAPR